MEDKCLFIHIPRTAGTSIVRSLNPYVVIHGSPYVAPNTDYLKSFAFRFAFVRNPYDRYASVVLNLGFAKVENFEEFTLGEFSDNYEEKFAAWDFDWMPLIPQYQYLYFDGVREVDFVGRFENLEEDWMKVCDRLGRHEHLGMPFQLEHLNASGRQYRDLYTADMLDVVRNAYKDDFLAFGYPIA